MCQVQAGRQSSRRQYTEPGTILIRVYVCPILFVSSIVDHNVLWSEGLLPQQTETHVFPTGFIRHLVPLHVLQDGDELVDISSVLWGVGGGTLSGHPWIMTLPQVYEEGGPLRLPWCTS
jgi:hypothetical protein